MLTETLTIKGIFMEPVKIVLDNIEAMGTAFFAKLPELGIALVVLVFTWIIVRLATFLLNKAMKKGGLRRTLRELFSKLLSIGIWLMGILIAAAVVFPGLTPANILTAVGLGSVAIGFAFKDIFENFIAGILILFREPFRIRDFIECEDVEGHVEEITIRDTHIRMTDGQRVVIPNAMLFKNPVWVKTDRDQRRMQVICGVGYGEDVDKCREIITKAVKSVESVNTDQPIQVYASEFNSSSIDFDIRWWTGSQPGDLRRSRDELIAAVKRALDDAGVEIPFPYQTLTFAEPLEVQGPAGKGANGKDEKNPEASKKSSGKQSETALQPS